MLRVDLSRLPGAAGAPDVRDITVACIGECSQKYTGARDGKSLHKFLTRGLLLRAGVPSPQGFFTRYEVYLKRATPRDSMECVNGGTIARKPKGGNPFEQFFSLFKKKGDSTKVLPNTVPKVDTGGPVSKNQD